jgi:hypothetical protein
MHARLTQNDRAVFELPPGVDVSPPTSFSATDPGSYNLGLLGYTDRFLQNKNPPTALHTPCIPPRPLTLMTNDQLEYHLLLAKDGIERSSTVNYALLLQMGFMLDFPNVGALASLVRDIRVSSSTNAATGPTGHTRVPKHARTCA